jgi:hypothetical protein
MKRVWFGLGVVVLAAVAAYVVRPASVAQERPADGERPFTAEFVSLVKKSNCQASMDLEKVKLVKLDGRAFLVGTGADTPDNWQKGKTVYVALDDISEVTTFATLEEMRKAGTLQEAPGAENPPRKEGQ